VSGFNSKEKSMIRSELARAMAQTVLRYARGLRCVRAGTRVWIAHDLSNNFERAGAAVRLLSITTKAYAKFGEEDE